MKNTGIVRRIDDLGRVVVPKELRRTLKIQEGDPMEMWIKDNGEIVMKKYSPLGIYSGMARRYINSLNNISGFSSCIVDMDQVIPTSRKVNPFDGKETSSFMVEIIKDRKLLRRTNDVPFKNILFDKSIPFEAEIIAPIWVDGDPIGALILLSHGVKATELEEKLVMLTVESIIHELQE